MPPEGVLGVIPVVDLIGENEEDTALLKADQLEAERFLLSKTWCLGIKDLYFGAGLGGVASVFLAELEHGPAWVDTWLWVVVGDIPPAYLVLDDCPTPLDAITTYIDLMQEWVDLARDGKSSAEVIAVDVPATPENAAILQTRLDALLRDVVPWIEEEAKSG